MVGVDLDVAASRDEVDGTAALLQTEVDGESQLERCELCTGLLKAKAR